MDLCVEPLKSLCTQKLNIFISKLPSKSKVKLKAKIKFPWANNVTFESNAWFTADEYGNVDLSKQKPDSGDYDFVDSMGLVFSLKLTKGNLKDFAENISIDESFFIYFEMEYEGTYITKKVERTFLSQGVTREKIEDVFVGELFCSNVKDAKTIVVLGGSNGNLNAILPICSSLACEGFNVLGLAYFSENTLPKKLSEVPLEYFEKAFYWLKNNSKINCDEIYIHGTSKGGELSLILASVFPYIKKIAAFAPQAYCFQAPNFKYISSWSQNGKQLPYIRIKNSVIIMDMINSIIKNEPFKFSHSYKNALANPNNNEDARIKIENSSADILLFAGTDDGIWNTADGCEVIINKLTQTNYNHKFKYVLYEEAGHSFYVPYVLPISLSTIKIAPRFYISMGGTLEANAQSCVDSWNKMIDFFND